MKSKQLELDVSRRRVKIEDDAAPLEARQHEVEALVGCTGWHDGRKVEPTCSGWWDATSHSTASSKVCRLWFDAETRQWKDNRRGGLVYAAPLWRGLKGPWPLGYTYKVRRLRVRIEESA